MLHIVLFTSRQLGYILHLASVTMQDIFAVVIAFFFQLYY